MNKLVLLFLLMFCLVQLRINAQNDLDEKVRTQIISNTDTLALKSFKEKQKQKSEINKEKINNLIKKNPNLLIRSSKNGKTIELKEIKNGRPVYRTTFNRVAAQTTSTDDVWSSPFNLDGSGINIGLWDGGAVDEFHTSFREGTYGQKHVFYVDPDTIPIDDHATHVAGTIVADDDNFNSKGMASKSIIISRDWNEDVIEMTNAAALLDPNFPNGILLSNHSYATITGWEWGDLRKVGSDAWYWMAGNMDIEDPDFGNYNEASFDYDEIAFNAPYYTIVWAAGNDRGQGPEPNTQHWVWNGQNWVTSTSYHPKDGEVTNGFNCLPPDGVAKNIITVGAIDDIFNGYQNSSDVKQVNTDFSSWGPTKDGRIKPDIVANGDELYSTLPNLTFGNMSGTSMAAPNVTGSIALLLQHYKNTHSGYVPLSSTVKAILIHSADESGDHPGPDYKYGWGLLNTYKAAQLISLDQTNPTTIQEMDLLNGQPRTISNLYNDGTQPIKITLTWNDIPPVNMVGGPILMRDLDVRLIKGGVTYYPYKLNSASPSSAAITGDNNRDNVEQIFLQSPGAGYYTIVVSHKGTISTQKFSLITTGFIEPFVTFYLKQLGNDNQPFGQASYWDNSIWNSVPPAQPITLSLDKHHFLSIQDFKPLSYEKFNRWEDNLSNKCYRNWDTLSLKATTTQVFSRFIPKITGITIKNSLEGTTLSGGNIKFKDPWLADTTEPPYGLRNQGMSAPFREQPSPFTPDLTSSYNGYVYKGIFLNQSGPGSGWQGAYYKVGMPDEQIISVNGQNRKFYPFKWTGTGVTLQIEYGNETGIVFNSSNAVAIATLKGQLMSNSTTGISSNSQRKMVRTDNGIYHLVYESMGNVYYTHSLTSNFDGSWSQEELLRTNAKNPAIEYHVNNVKIVFEFYDPVYGDDAIIYLSAYAPNASGVYTQVVNECEEVANFPVSYFGNAKPVISYNQVQLFIAYRKNSTEGLKERTKWLNINTGLWNWSSEAAIPGTNLYSINPSVVESYAHIHLVYESQNSIMYKYAVTESYAGPWQYEAAINVSTGSGFTKNNYPNISISNGLQTYLLVSWLG
ncbi:MAG TPA: S8 family serine peptidase, partial [Ignavibacteriaceae bacterium]|nr:S8 family serine peptidase [Ignavibacteriaceae bacterium]